MPVISLKGLTAKQLRQAATIRERIDELEKQLAAILGGGGGGGGEVEAKPKRQMSAAARAKIAAAQKRRWARAKGASS